MFGLAFDSLEIKKGHCQEERKTLSSLIILNWELKSYQIKKHTGLFLCQVSVFNKNSFQKLHIFFWRPSRFLSSHSLFLLTFKINIFMCTQYFPRNGIFNLCVWCRVMKNSFFSNCIFNYQTYLLRCSLGDVHFCFSFNQHLSWI